MKKIILLIFSVLYSAYLLAFDYQIIYSGRTCFFQGYAVLAYKVDSLKLIDGDSLFYPNVSLVQISSCVKMDGSWIGKKVLVKPNGDNIIYNNNNEELLIRTQAKLGDKWDFYTLRKNIVATAEVTEYKKVDFFGLTDSVKIITVTVNDLRNQYYPQRSTFLLKISKKYGFLSTLDFYGFPETYSGSFTLVGMTNPTMGVQNLLWKDVMDVQVGDEVHMINYVSRNPNPLSECQIVKERYKYLERRDIENQIQFKILYETQDSLSASTNLKYYTDTVRRVVYEAYYPKNNDFFDQLPSVPILDTTSSSDFKRYACVHMNDANTKSFGNELYGSMSDSCYQNMIIWDCFGWCGGCSPFTYYQKGLADISRNGTIVYSRKGDISWGTPLSLTAITGIYENVSASVIYSPSTHSLVVKASPDILPALLYVFDVSGKLVIRSAINEAQSALLFNSLPSGVYVYKLVSENSLLTTGRVILSK